MWRLGIYICVCLPTICKWHLPSPQRHHSLSQFCPSGKGSSTDVMCDMLGPLHTICTTSATIEFSCSQSGGIAGRSSTSFKPSRSQAKVSIMPFSWWQNAGDFPHVWNKSIPQSSRCGGWICFWYTSGYPSHLDFLEDISAWYPGIMYITCIGICIDYYWNMYWLFRYTLH